MRRGRFITLEGGEGVGKSTNLQFIRQFIENSGINVIATREPGGTVIAEKIRHILIDPNEESLTENAELLLVFAARAQHIRHVILPALERGVWVLCDRFTDATYAYQGGGRQMSLEAIGWLENIVQGELRPDLTILLDAPVELGLKRAKHRGKLDRFESEERSFFDRMRQVYLQRAEQEKNRYKIIDASLPLLEVQDQIRLNLTSLISQ